MPEAKADKSKHIFLFLRVAVVVVGVVLAIIWVSNEQRWAELKAIFDKVVLAPSSFNLQHWRFIVVRDQANKEKLCEAAFDQPQVKADTDGPEVRILRGVDPVESEPRVGRVHLQVEGLGLDDFLLFAFQPVEAGGEGVGDAEFHQGTW